ncbi:hypothetical protein GCM10009733_092580 [Nonomuraea maheshkhaliensis]|uniref:Lipoprotein n=1 Tax=Nonomuraea maheshkhaliensis TaxID=419590 RepID=A0ABP4T2S9_9ACTN
MDRLLRIVATLVMMTSVVSCSVLGIGCEKNAARDVEELKRIVLALLPVSVSSTMQEGNGCDSGDGGYLLFTADRETSIDGLEKSFLAKGWKEINLARDDISRTIVGGVTKLHNGRDVKVVIGLADDSSKVNIFVTYSG